MSSHPRAPRIDAIISGCVLLTLAGADPVLGQAAQGISDIDVRPSESDMRMIGETEKNLADVLRSVRIHFTRASAGDFVLSLTRVTRGRVVARSESPPIRIDAVSVPGGVSLGRVLEMEPLSGVAPLRAAEFVVTGYSLANRPVSALVAAANPGPAFPRVQGHALIVAVIPANDDARRRTRSRPLLLEIAGAER